MENPGQFDLGAAIRRWREDLNQFQQFRAENLDELEAHLRDSIDRLRESGLSEQEAFVIARSRIGRPERLETEFAKVAPRPANKIIHGLVFLFFSTGCFFLWGLLTVSRMMEAMVRADGRPLPGFTQLCLELRWVFYVLPILAGIYLAIVCLRRVPRVSWVGFFASSAAVLILLALPVGVAVLLPVIDFMNRVPR